MRPIDTIRERIDSDLVKYHASNLYIIDSDDDVANITGIGPCAVVRPFTLQETSDDIIRNSKTKFPVMIINRPYGWLESNISTKYYVLLLSPVVDRALSVNVGFLVSKTFLQRLENFLEMRKMATSDQAMAAYDENFTEKGGRVTLQGATEQFGSNASFISKQVDNNLDIS
jgi:hypothetical protein